MSAWVAVGLSQLAASAIGCGVPLGAGAAIGRPAAESRQVLILVSQRWTPRDTATDGCWEWDRVGNHGYGEWKGLLAHRVSYELASGEVIPEGLHIDHLCRNRRCCNPEHLEAVTPMENAQRAAKLNAELVAALREQVESERNGGRLPKGRLQELAGRYGVAASTLTQALNGHNWRTA